jgi:hypothetical protein
VAVFRVEKNRNYTVMSNYHLRDTHLSLKAVGLLSKMLSLTDEWNYTTRGLASICKEGVDAIGATLRELEACNYLVRTQLRDSKGRISDTEYVIYEQPHTPLPDTPSPDTEKPYLDKPDTDEPYPKKPAQLNIDIRNPDVPKKELSITEPSNPYQSNPPTAAYIPRRSGYHASSAEIGEHISFLLQLVRETAPETKILLLSPIFLGDEVWKAEFDPEFDKWSVTLSKQLRDEYRRIAQQTGSGFLAASDYAQASAVDMEHLDEAGHAALAQALYVAIKSMFEMELTDENR